MPNYRYSPKYWDAKDKFVREGVKTRRARTQLRDILGTYVWVFSGDPEWGGDVVEEHFEDYSDFVGHHSMTLTTDKPEAKVSPGSVKGCINWGTYKITYKALRRVPRGNTPNKWVRNCWEVVFNGEGDDEVSGESWLREDNNLICVTEVLDENGNPFVTFDWSHPPGGHYSWSGYYLGKKMVEGKRWELTGQERDDLGIGYSFKGMEKNATGKSKAHYYWEDEEDNEPSEDSEDEDSDENSGSEGEERIDDGDDKEETSGDGGGEASSKANLGEKRKVGGNDLGTNKRLRDK